MTELAPPRAGLLRLPMRGRSTEESHRSASQLELLFDLTFVVAVSALTGQLAEGIAQGEAGATLAPFLQVFFAIWWAWMNFTWFASSYDTDDVAYRLLTFIQMVGVLVLAAGVPGAMEENDYLAVTGGYLIMRIGLVAQWLRACTEDRPRRRTALRYAAGISIAEVLWLLRLSLADTLPGSSLLPIFVLLAGFELAVPWWAEHRNPTTWHPHHIAERYGLFAIILLGEGIFAASARTEEVLDRAGVTGPFVAVAGGGFTLVFGLWWLYFAQRSGDGLASHRSVAFRWGYGHYGLFASLVAVGAGLEVTVEQTGHHVRASDMAVAGAVALPVATFLGLLWFVQRPMIERPTVHPSVTLGAVGASLLAPLTAPVVGVAGVVVALSAIVAALVATTVLSQTGARPGH